MWQLWQLQRVAVLLEHKFDVRNTSKSKQKYRIAISAHLLDSFLQSSPFVKVCGEVFLGTLSTHDQRNVSDWMISQPRLVKTGQDMLPFIACTMLTFPGAACLAPKRWWNRCGRLKLAPICWTVPGCFSMCSLYHATRMHQDSLMNG